MLDKCSNHRGYCYFHEVKWKKGCNLMYDGFANPLTSPYTIFSSPVPVLVRARWTCPCPCLCVHLCPFRHTVPVRLRFMSLWILLFMFMCVSVFELMLVFVFMFMFVHFLLCFFLIISPPMSLPLYFPLSLSSSSLLSPCFSSISTLGFSTLSLAFCL